MKQVSKNKFMNILTSIISTESELSKAANELIKALEETVNESDYTIGFNIFFEDDEDESSWMIEVDNHLWCQSDCVPSRDSWWSLMVEIDKRLN